jgi:hypothetical protein
MLRALLIDVNLSQVSTAIRLPLPLDSIFVFDLYEQNLAYVRAPLKSPFARSDTRRGGRKPELWEDSNHNKESRGLSVHSSAVRTLRLCQNFSKNLRCLAAVAGLFARQCYEGFNRSPFLCTSNEQILIYGRG